MKKVTSHISRASIFLILFLTIFLHSLQGNATNNELRFTDYTLKEALDTIADKYHIFFSYDKSLLEDIKVDFELDENESLFEAIDRLIKMTNLSYESFGDKYFVIYKKTKEGAEDLSQLLEYFDKINKIEDKGNLLLVNQQNSINQQRSELISMIKKMEQQEIKGTVTAADGTPIPGANVLIKGTTRGFVTDIDGNFSFEGELPVTLVVSYIGFNTKEIKITSIAAPILIELSEGFALDDIVVTARRRPERIQDTPISITAIQGPVLEEMGVDDLSGIGDMAPNLTFSTTGTVSGSSSAAVVFMRGIGQNDYVPVADPGVGIYVDDVYLGRTIGAVLDIVDLKSVEVIRGPQGTLFGRNTIGGAIALTSNDPGEEFAGKISVTGGSYTRNDASVALSGPLSEEVGISFNFVRRNREGYVERVNVEDSWLGNDNMHGFKVKLNWGKPDTKFSAKLIADYVVEREESAPEQNLFFRPDTQITNLWNTGAGVSTAQGYVEGDQTAGTDIYDERLNLGPFKTGETSLSQNDIDSYGISANLNYEFKEGLASKLILAYRNLDAKFARQVDGSAFSIFENRDVYLQDQFSADFRLNKKSDKLDLVAGLFYFNEKVDNQLNFTGVLQGVAWPAFVGGEVDNSNYAVYGEGTYKITDQFSLTAGLRYTNETKKAMPDAFTDPTASIENRPDGPAAERDPVTNPGRLLDKIWQENSFDKVTWRFNAAYKISNSVNVYASVATGFKSGGFEWRVTNSSFYDDPSNDFDGDGDGDLPQFRPETVTSYEIGSKFDLRNTDFRFNFAAFYTSYNDMQIAANPPGSIATFQTNAGDSEIKGIEAEVIWVPVSSVLLNVGYGLIDAEYTDLIEGVTVSEDDKFILTPEHMVTFGASYKFPLGEGNLTTRIDGHYKSEMHFEAENSDFVFDDGHTALNASIRYNTKKHWGITAGVDNLTDELYVIGGDANTAIGYENGIYARPRNYYVTLSYSF